MKYEIKGAPFSVAELHLEKGESIYCETGSMCWQDPQIEMHTSTGGLGKLISRTFTHDTLFLNEYVAKQPGKIALATCYPGDIKVFKLQPGQEIIAQKASFMGCSTSIKTSIFFQKKIGVGLFGGEGFIMNRYSGEGYLFLEIDGSCVEYTLEKGQQLIVDTGYLAIVDGTCKIDIKVVKGIKNKFFGGEGLFHTVVTGPGRVVLQTMPIQTFAGSLSPYMSHPEITTAEE